MYLRTFLKSLLIAASLPGLTICSPTKREVTISNAQSAYEVLQQWYDEGSGVWKTTGWWGSANCIDVIGQLAAIDGGKKNEIMSVLSNTFTRANGGYFMNRFVAVPSPYDHD